MGRRGLTTSTARRIGASTLLGAAVLLLSAGLASAAKVDLKNAVASTSGPDRLKIEDFGTCAGGLRLMVVFDESKRKVVARDQFGTTYKGGYSQSGTDGRKIRFDLSDKTRTKLRRAMEDQVRRCTGARSVDAKIDRLVLTGKINRSLDRIKVKGRIEGHGDTNLGDGDALYTFKTEGPLVRVGP